MFHTPENYRTKTGTLGSDESYGNNGAFTIPFESYELTVIASDGEGWEHASVSLNNRIPNWREMSFIKDLFWDSDDCVVQYHPSKKDYIDNHPNCLHLWKQIDKEFPQPPFHLVGIK